MVLAEGAAHVAAEAADRKNIASGIKTHKRLLFYRVESNRAEPSVICADVLPVFILSDSAEACPPLV